MNRGAVFELVVGDGLSCPLSLVVGFLSWKVFVVNGRLSLEVNGAEVVDEFNVLDVMIVDASGNVSLKHGEEQASERWCDVVKVV